MIDAGPGFVCNRPMVEIREAEITLLETHLQSDIVEKLEESLKDAISMISAREITVNLGMVQVIDSSALGVIIKAQKFAKDNGKEIMLTKAGDNLRELFRISRIDMFLKIED